MTHNRRDFKYLLLDWDGCMSKTLEVWMGVYLEVYRKEGLDPSRKEIIDKSWGNLAKGPENFGLKDPKRVWQKIVDQVAKNVKKVPLYPGVKESLKELRSRGKRMAIVTSSERKIVEPAISFHNLQEIIDELITEEEVNKPKPDPEIINLALNRLDGKAKQSIIIGDTRKDIKAGKNVDIATVLVLHEENREFYDFNKLRAENPDYTAGNFKEILQIV